jgi:hypothetical protein
MPVAVYGELPRVRLDAVIPPGRKFERVFMPGVTPFEVL